MQPIMSIIIPVYNGERFITAAMESVQAQTLADWELIVVDDGSTDATPIILAEAAVDERRRVVRQDNAGLAAARNWGLAEATAPYVAFLDADDRWHPSYLAEMCAALDKAPRAPAAFTGWRGI